MASPEMIAQLLKRKQELIKELQAIDVLLGANQMQQQSNPQVAQQHSARLGYLSTRDIQVAQLQEKTEAISWKDYVSKAVTILGSSRSAAITNLIIDANDHKIPDSRIKNSVSSALSALVKEKKVTVILDEEKQKVFSMSL